MTTASAIIPLAVAASVLAGLGVVGVALVVSWKTRRFRPAHALMGSLIGAVLINSWWLALGALVAFKFLVLREDT